MSVKYKQQKDSPRFSVNSNLMNYSIPQSNNDQASISKRAFIESNNKREMQRGDSDTRTRQLEAQIEQLTLQNVKLQRTNRLLKVDTDNLIEQKTSPLEKTIQELTVANVRLQRASRLLQQELDQRTAELNTFKQNQILQMKSVGPEYEFLVQNINLLQRQIAGHPLCEDTCCFTMQPIDQSTMVMTLPCADNDSETDEEEEVEAQHICRPIIHSTISQGSYAVELENKITRLEHIIEELDEEKQQILRQQGYKDNDVETLKKELRIKDEIVSQLEQDFMGLEDQLEHLQKELQDQTMFNSNNSDTNHSNIRSLLTPPPIQSDPKRQSQMLMESKRRSLAIKDTDLLEQMLRGDLEGFNNHHHHPHQQQQGSMYQPSDDDEEETNEGLELEDEDSEFDLHLSQSSLSSSVAALPEDHNSSRGHTNTIMLIEEERGGESKKGINETTASSCFKCDGFPCTFPCKHSHNTTDSNKNDPFALFTCATIALSLASQLGITDDWTVPITLAALVSSFLWNGSKNKKKMLRNL